MEILFYLFSFLLIYTYLGYPLIVFFVSRFINKKTSIDNSFEPEVSVIIVVHNAEKHLQNKIDNILSSAYPYDKLELCIISDGSTDKTVTILDQNKNRIKYKSFSERRGKAACINDAIKFASHDYIVFADVRQEFKTDTITCLIKPLSDNSLGAVSGELVFVDKDHNTFSQGIDAYWRYEKLIRSSEARLDSVIGVTGAVYSIRRSAFKEIPEGVVLDDVLIPMQMILDGYRVIFVNSAIAYDVPSSDQENEKRRKIRTLAGNYQLIKLCPNLINPIKNRMFIQFLSHKIMRLLAPFFMIGILITSAILAYQSNLYLYILMLQVIAYVIAYYGYHNDNKRLTKYKLIRIMNTFIFLNWYSFLALIEFLKGKKTHLW